ncbi:MAG: hypothetical protein V4589_11695 [Bacteroidota bacterium]
MDCVSVKDKIERISKEVSGYTQEHELTSKEKQFAVDSLLDKILGFQKRIKVKSERVAFISAKFEEFSWFIDMDDECLDLMRGLLDTALEYHKALIKYYVARSWAIRKGIARESMYEFKNNIDDLKERIHDLNEIFFVLKNDEDFNDITKKLENL